MTQISDVADSKRAGLEALARGDLTRARERLQAALAVQPRDIDAWLALSRAHAASNDPKGEIEALDKVLELQPRDLRALLWKGDCLARTGQAKAATAFYQAALRAAPSQRAAAAQLEPDLKRAVAACEQHKKALEDSIYAGITRAGFQPGKSSPRFQQALDIMFGRKQPYLQSPRFFFFPELAHVQFFDRKSFPWLDEVEAATGSVRAELLGVLRDEQAFTPYVEEDPNLPRNDQMGMLNNPNWGAYYLVKNGSVIADHVERCPKTYAVLGAVPMPGISKRCPSALFSLLRPKTRIPPHNGLINTRLICHLPLIVPPGCGFRVGNDTREWKEGQAWVFDDTIEHEAWNDSNELRVILIFETWRPEFTEEERALVSAMFQAIDAYTGVTPEWEI